VVGGVGVDVVVTGEGICAVERGRDGEGGDAPVTGGVVGCGDGGGGDWGWSRGVAARVSTAEVPELDGCRVLRGAEKEVVAAGVYEGDGCDRGASSTVVGGVKTSSLR
jgi:hypothetical protein